MKSKSNDLAIRPSSLRPHQGALGFTLICSLHSRVTVSIAIRIGHLVLFADVSYIRETEMFVLVAFAGHVSADL